MHHKGQTSLEFIIILSIVFVLTLFFISSIYSTFDTTFAVYKVKNDTLNKISLNNFSLLLEKIDYDMVDRNITFKLFFKQLNTDKKPFDINDYNNTIDDINKGTRFNNINFKFDYYK